MNDGVEHIENTWIPLPDGCRLAARIWRPETAFARPVPALLEYLPYRKRDFMRFRDEPMHRYFARHGYASVRVDLRGSGDSGGLLFDEYTREEQEDGVAVIAWLAEQPWCNGAIGMFGISWGGFNSLQVAALQPPALKAIMSLCASDDRYADDAHYMGGCLLTENLQWGSIFMMNQALPPDPDLVGDAWREEWRQRLDALPNFPETWLRQPWRDDYWREASVRDHIDRIRIPVYAIGGWADAYSNSILRLAGSVSAPVKGLIGPWAHTFPHLGVPGPAIGFLQEALRWWDRWLKGIDTGIDREPSVRAWMQEWVKPEPQYERIPGRWVAEARWPSPRIKTETYYLCDDGCRKVPGEPVDRVLSSPQTCGIRGGEWCAFGSDGEMPRDQRPDDGVSMTWDTRRLESPVEILGTPVVRLTLSADRSNGLLAVRLCDVAPDGTSLRVTYGVLNLAHRKGHARPEPLEPGRKYDVEIRLNDIAHVFSPGHRIRVAVSTAYWPVVWPASAPVSLTIRTGDGTLALPVRPPDPADERLPAFAEPAMAEAPPVKRIRHHEFSRRLAVDLTSNRYHYELQGSEFSDASLVYFEDIDLRVGYTISKFFEIVEDDPLSAMQTIRQRSVLSRGDWRVSVSTEMRLTSTATEFRLNGWLEAEEGDEAFARRDWDVSVPRRLV